MSGVWYKEDTWITEQNKKPYNQQLYTNTDYKVYNTDRTNKNTTLQIYLLMSIWQRLFCEGFIIQARNALGQNRQSGRDEIAVVVQQHVFNDEGRESMMDRIACKFVCV